MGVVCSVALMLSLPPDTWLRLVVWMVLGLVIYFVFGVRNSVLGNPEKSGTQSSA
jgi:APA family basic amino acid/polyamine antiporter